MSVHWTELESNSKNEVEVVEPASAITEACVPDAESPGIDTIANPVPRAASSGPPVWFSKIAVSLLVIVAVVICIVSNRTDDVQH